MTEWTITQEDADEYQLIVHTDDGEHIVMCTNHELLELMAEAALASGVADDPWRRRVYNDLLHRRINDRRQS